MSNQNTTPAHQAPSIGSLMERKFVKVIGTRPDGLVMFEFSIGWPELAVELMLPPEAFEHFCARERVIRLDR